MAFLCPIMAFQKKKVFCIWSNDGLKGNLLLCTLKDLINLKVVVVCLVVFFPLKAFSAWSVFKMRAWSTEQNFASSHSCLVGRGGGKWLQEQLFLHHQVLSASLSCLWLGLKHNKDKSWRWQIWGKQSVCRCLGKWYRFRSEPGWRDGKTQLGGVIAGDGVESAGKPLWNPKVTGLSRLFPWLTRVAGDRRRCFLRSAPCWHPEESPTLVGQARQRTWCHFVEKGGGRSALTFSSLKRVPEEVTHTCKPRLWGHARKS